MLKFIRKLFGIGDEFEDVPGYDRPPQPPRRIDPRKAQQSGRVRLNIDGEVDPAGPGKHALIRNKYVREDTGTHETLKILDDSIIDTGEEAGIDPYNTGNFDRSKNWDKRFRR